MASRIKRTLPLNTRPGTASKATSAPSPALTRCSEFCWKAAPSAWSLTSVLTKTMTGRSGDDIYARPQRDLGDESRAGRARDGLFEVPFGIAQFGAQAGDRGVDALDIRRIGEARALLLGSRPRQRLSRSFQIAGVRIEGRLREQLGLP